MGSADSGKRPAAAGSEWRLDKRGRYGASLEQSAFQRLVGEGGCSLASDRASYEMADPQKLQLHLESRLVLNDELRKDFIESLQELIQEPEALRIALLPSNLGSGSPGDSLLRVVLEASPVQTEVAEVLLHRLVECGDEGGEGNSSDGSMALRILSLFRWLNHVVDPNAITRRALEVLSVCPEHVQREIIAFLPELAVEEDYSAIVDALEDLLSTDTAFVIAAISTFSNMSMEGSLQERAALCMLSKLSSADAQDLPELIKYLTQNAVGEAALEAVKALRKELHFLSPSDPRLPVPDRKQKGTSVNKTVECQVIEGLRNGLHLAARLSRREMLEAFMAEIKADDKHGPLDFWVLAMIHSLGGRDAQAADSLLRHKLGDGKMTRESLSRAVPKRTASILQLVPAISSIASGLMKQSQASLRTCGGLLFKNLFLAFSHSNYHRQELLGELMSSTGSSSPTEATAALETLVELAEEDTLGMLQFAAFLGTLLDYLASFTDHQLHLVFQLFSTLVVSSAEARGSGSGGGGGTRLEDELHVVISKQMSSADPRHKRIGIIGTVAHIRQLASGDVTSRSAESAVEAIRMLVHMMAACQGKPACLCFLYDELSNLLEARRMPEFIRRWLYTHQIDSTLSGGSAPVLPAATMDTVGTDLENRFLMDYTTGDTDTVEFPGHGRLAPQAALNLDGEDSPVMLKLTEMLCSKNASELSSLVHLAAQFRLMRLLEKEEQGGLEGIDALLGCPVSMPSRQLLANEAFWDSSPTTREIVALVLFHAINWCRELVNAFHDSIPQKAALRCRDLLLMERQLAAALQGLPATFKLPSLADPLETHQVSVKAAAGLRPPSGGRKAGKENRDRPASIQAPHQAGSQVSGQAGKSSKAGKGQQDQRAEVSIHARLPLGLRGAMRPLQPKLIALLGPTLEAAPSPVGPDALSCILYLLEDLKDKMSAVFAKPKPAFLTGGKSPPPPPTGLGLAGVSQQSFLEYLQPHLHSLRRVLDITTESARLSAEQGEMVEFGNLEEVGQTILAPSHLLATRIFSMALECVHQLLQHTGAQGGCNAAFQRDLLLAFSDRRPASTAGSAAFEVEEACGAAFDYFQAMSFQDKGEFQNELCIAGAMQSVVECLRAATCTSPDTPRLARLRTQLSLFASSMLEATWEHCPEADGNAGTGQGWKGRNQAMAELLHLHIRYAENPVETINTMATDNLSQVSTGKGSAGRRPHEVYPGLCATTIPVWYRILHEELAHTWEALVSEGVNLIKRRARCSEETVARAASDGLLGIKVFNHLTALVKTHESKAQVQAVSVKHATRFIDGFMKWLPFWEARWEMQRDTFASMISQLQKATRTLQILSCEGKKHKDASVVSRIPLLKRTMERFIFRMKAFFHGTDLVDKFWMGNLKHKNLRGEEVCSQAEDAEDSSQGEEQDGDDATADYDEEEES